MSDTKRERAARKAERAARAWGSAALFYLTKKSFDRAEDNAMAYRNAVVAARHGREALGLRAGTVWTGDCE